MIGKGSHVEITTGEFFGCFGIVQDIYLDDDKKPVLSVEVWFGREGRFLWTLFTADELRPHPVPPLTAEMFLRLSAQMELEEAA